MTPEQKEIAISFNRIVFLPGTWNKRFAQSMTAIALNNPEKEITSNTDQWLYRIVYTFRRQIPDIYNKYKNNPNCNKLK